MKTLVFVGLFGCAFLAINAQQKPEAVVPKAAEADTRLLESKIRQAWEDYKNKNKDRFASIFTDDAVEVEEGTDGAHDKKATLAEMDEYDLTSIDLSDFHYRSIGADGILVRYNVKYAGNFDGEAIDNKSIIGEVWEKTANEWKLVYFQETKIK
jgi:hypothetical protein